MTYIHPDVLRVFKDEIYSYQSQTFLPADSLIEQALIAALNANTKALTASAGVSSSDPWHEAVMNACMMTEACYVEADPAASVRALIDWHIQMDRHGRAAAPAPEGFVDRQGNKLVFVAGTGMRNGFIASSLDGGPSGWWVNPFENNVAPQAAAAAPAPTLSDDAIRAINREIWGYVSKDHTRMWTYARAIEKAVRAALTLKEN